MSPPVGEAAQLLSRYAWAIDERRWEALGEVFTADAVADYEAFVCHGVSELVDRMRELHDGLDATQHLIGSLLVEEQGASLVVRSHVQATLVKRGHSGGPTVTVLARYDDDVRRTPAGLRIARRSVDCSVTSWSTPSG